MELFKIISRKYALPFLVLTGFLLYSYSLFNGFVGDDFDQLVTNPMVHSIQNIPYFFRGGTFNNGFVSLSGIYYKPLMTTTFSLLYTFFGSTPFFYHLTQLILHSINSILVFYLFKKFFPKPTAFFTALIFLIHPMNTEAVVYISNLQDVLFTFFGLVGLLLIIYKQLTLKTLVVINLSFLCSLLSKETGSIFLLFSILYLFLYKKKYLQRQLIATFAIGLLYSILRITAVGLYSYQTENFPMMQLTLSQRLISMPEILLYYLKVYFYPVNLAFAQNWVVREITVTTFFLPLLVISILVFLIAYLGYTLSKEDRKAFFFFTTILVVGISLHLQILPLDMTVADRWFYVPMIGSLGLNILAIRKIPFNKLSPTVLTYGSGTLVLLLFCLTFARSLNWQSQYTLYEHDVKYNTTSFSLLNGWASELMNRGRYDEAEPFIRKSIALEPNFCYSWNNLGSIYANRKQYDNAREFYETALRRRACPLAYNNLATLMYYHFDQTEAYSYTKNALKEVPSSPRVWLMFSLLEYKRGNKDAALQAAKKSYLLSPNQAALFVYDNIRNDREFELKE